MKKVNKKLKTSIKPNYGIFNSSMLDNEIPENDEVKEDDTKKKGGIYGDYIEPKTIAFLRNPDSYDETRDYSSITQPTSGEKRYRYNKFLNVYEPSYWRKFEDEDARSGSSIDSQELSRRKECCYDFETGEPNCCVIL